MRPQGFSLLKGQQFESIEEFLEQHAPTPLTIEERIQKLNSSLEKKAQTFSQVTAAITNNLTEETPSQPLQKVV